MHLVLYSAAWKFVNPSDMVIVFVKKIKNKNMNNLIKCIAKQQFVKQTFQIMDTNGKKKKMYFHYLFNKSGFSQKLKIWHVQKYVNPFS